MVVYHSDECDISVDAYITEDSIWVTQKGMAEIFGVDKSGISSRLKNIFDTSELDEQVVVAKNATTTTVNDLLTRHCSKTLYDYM